MDRFILFALAATAEATAQAAWMPSDAHSLERTATVVASGIGGFPAIVEAVRTPIGRGHEEKGYYKDTHPSTLLAKTYAEAIERAGIEPSEVEDVVAGCVQQFGEQGMNIARNAWLEAGLPIETSDTV
jgi:transketolase